MALVFRIMFVNVHPITMVLIVKLQYVLHLVFLVTVQHRMFARNCLSIYL